MSKDRRPYSQIDVGWYMNPKWFQVERYLRDAMPNAMPDALLHALQDAKQLHLTSILYSTQARSDGMFPVDAIKSFARAMHEEAVTALFEAGMWINHPGGMAEIRHFLKHQQSSEELNEAAERGRQAANKRWKNAKRNASSNANPNAQTNAGRNTEKRREEKSIKSANSADAEPRHDVKEILDYLDAALAKNDVKLPSRTKKNVDAARLLIDKDNRSIDQIKKAIDFATRDWWLGNVLSMSKLREKYDQLRLQAQRTNNTPQQKQNNAANDRWELARQNLAKTQQRSQQ